MTEPYYAVDVEGREPKRFESGVDAGCYIWCNLPPCGGGEPQVYQCDGDGNCHPVNAQELVADYMNHFDELVYGLREQPDAGAVMPAAIGDYASCPVCGAPSDGYPCRGCVSEGDFEVYEPEDPGAVDDEYSRGDGSVWYMEPDDGAKDDALEDWDNEREPGDEHFWPSS